MAKRLITSKAALALKDGKTHSEPVGGRGAGTLLLVGRSSQVSAYYRYTAPNGTRPWIDLGVLSPRFTLEMARAQAIELWQLRKQFPHLKEHIEEKSVVEKARLEKEKCLRAAELSSATLAELINDYVAHLVSQGKESATAIGKALDTVVINAHPMLSARKAKTIEPADIREILTPLSKRDKKVYRNRIRSYLHAAFKFGLDREYDETRVSEKSFGLTGNPVAAIPVLSGVEFEGVRSLSEEELRQFYDNLPDVPSVGPVMAFLVRFLIATAGQRPSQVLRVPWSDYDLENGFFKIIDKKGRGSKPRVHLVPLTDRANKILQEVRPFTGGYEWPFSHAGKCPISIQSLKNVTRRFLGSIHGNGIHSFTIRDLRRTCKQLMTRAKMPREQRNLLQNHGFSGVDSKHYDNDPTAHLPAKQEAIQRYERALNNVLSGKGGGNVIPLNASK